MAPTKFTKVQSSGEELEIDEHDELSQEIKDLILTLPRERGWIYAYVYLFQGFWCSPRGIQTLSTLQKHFQAKDSDVFVATIPKSGTTWLKALTFATLNRQKFTSFNNHPLLTSNPHDLVPFFELTLDAQNDNNVPDLSNIPEPRLFGTHIPFSSFPNSIEESNCKIVYICRNPFDTFVSSWFFFNQINQESRPKLALEEAFEMYCKGIIEYGPFWNHILGYWRQSKERPNKVLFLKYEDLKGDVNLHLKRVAEFLKCPFTLEEESGGVLENIVKLCSFEKMKELEVNKFGTFGGYFENKFLFRKGEIGDWVNYFSPLMVEKLNNVIEEKLGGSGLSFRFHS